MRGDREGKGRIIPFSYILSSSSSISYAFPFYLSYSLRHLALCFFCFSSPSGLADLPSAAIIPAPFRPSNIFSCPPPSALLPPPLPPFQRGLSDLFPLPPPSAPRSVHLPLHPMLLEEVCKGVGIYEKGKEVEEEGREDGRNSKRGGSGGGGGGRKWVRRMIRNRQTN